MQIMLRGRRAQTQVESLAQETLGISKSKDSGTTCVMTIALKAMGAESVTVMVLRARGPETMTAKALKAVGQEGDSLCDDIYQCRECLEADGPKRK